MKITTVILVVIIGIIGPIYMHQAVPVMKKTGIEPANNNASFTTPANNGISVAGWFPYWDKKRAVNTFEKNIDTFNEVSPFLYNLNSNGSLTKLDNEKHLKSVARNHNVKFIPMISNNFDGQKVSSIINNKNLRRAHIKYLVNEAKRGRYDGIELDYEGLQAKDRNAFSIFIKELSLSMHRNKKVLSVTLMSKTKEPGTNSTAKAQDWKVMGRYADYLRIMAYDYHWKTSGAGPIAPKGWVEQIIRLAVRKMPAKKVVLGVGTYGYKWNGGGRAQSLDFQSISTRGFRRDRNSGELCSKDRKTWIQDSGSLKTKISLVKKYKIHGIAIWRIGGEDPKSWRVIKESR